MIVTPRQKRAVFESDIDRLESGGVILFMTSRKAAFVRVFTQNARMLWNDKNLLRLGVFYFASRRVTADIDVAPIGRERIED